MPKFFVSVILFVVMLWSIFVYLLLNTAPSEFGNIFLFLGILLFALGFTFSIPLFFYFKNRAHNTYFVARVVYRASLKWAFYIGLGMVGVLALRAFDIFNFLNGGLFLILYVVLFVYLKK